MLVHAMTRSGVVQGMGGQREKVFLALFPTTGGHGKGCRAAHVLFFSTWECRNPEMGG